MKVLFAVSNESISEAIVKKYQQMYKEIISSKNVYYFNAIIKELQKDKSYDRIVVSEDLEPFASKNYDTIDNFIFEKLDSISDEASNIQGEDIPIILISTDRRTKGENILVKLFGIGVYSALIGQDRSIEQVCNLINKPRSKKEAKVYYKISSNEVEYKAESEGNVSEIEIQNILAHYKKLGKNEEKYVESFNSIANQYTDAQLRLITKFLPLNVKAVLEANCPKYQQVVAYSGEANKQNEYRNPQSKFSKKQEKQQKTDKKAEKAGLKIESLKTEKNNAVLSKPVIIPTEVTTENVKKVTAKQNISNNQIQQRQVSQMSNNQLGNNPQVDKTPQMVNAQVDRTPQMANTQVNRTPQMANTQANQRPQALNNQVSQKPQMSNGQLNQMAQMANNSIKTKPQIANAQARPMPQMAKTQANQMSQVENKNTVQVKNPQTVQQDLNANSQQQSENVPQGNAMLNEQTEPAQVKRGRGRPKKNVTQNSTVQTEDTQPRRGRGRPKKVEQEKVSAVDDTLAGFQDNNADNSVLPGFSDDYSTQMNDSVLPGFDDYNEEENSVEQNNDGMLPGFDDYNEKENSVGQNNDGTLPGFDDYNVDNNTFEQSNDGTLPGFDDYNVDNNTFEQSNDGTLPGFDDYNVDNNTFEQNNDGTLPGFDDYNVDNNTLEQNNDETLPGFDNYNEEENSFEQNNDGTLPGFDDYNVDNNTFEQSNDGTLPGFGDYNEENSQTEQNNGTLPGFDNYNSENMVSNYTSNQNYNNVNAQEEHLETQTPISSGNTNNLVSGDQKIVGFVGTSKNGTSFIVDNLAQILSRQGIKVAILDLTQNKNAYYIYTKNEEELRKKAMNCMQRLQQGATEGIKVNPNLDVYTSVPGADDQVTNIDNVVNTLLGAYSLILVDCDFKSDYRYISRLQELYLVQSMDVLTIQPLTAYLRDLKAKGVLDQNKLRIIINKYVRVRSLTEKTVIGGMAFYNDPAMSFMTELFNRETVKYTVIPFDSQAYSKYLEGLVNCEISTEGYSKEILMELRKLANMVYPLIANGTRHERTNRNQKTQYGQYDKGGFSPQMNNTLNRMKNNY